MTIRAATSLFALAIGLAAASAMAFGGGGFDTDFDIEQCPKFHSRVGNEYFPLRPGTFRRYEGFDGPEFVELEHRILSQVQPITFRMNGRTKRVLARVLEEREWIDGELFEVSRNFYAACMRTGDVFYFGETVDIYENGRIANHAGAWRAGRNGALPGLIMPAVVVAGSMYVQETAPGVALDQAEHLAVGLQVVTPAGVFDNCLSVVETTPLEPGHQSFKTYAPGVGLILDNSLELVEYHN